jgi:hypothetical protein
MAQKVTFEMTDDLDGSPADVTVVFAVDGTTYEIGLSKPMPQQCAEPSTRTWARPQSWPGQACIPARPRRHSSAVVREWAKGRGLKVSERGRIPADVVVEYEKAHG